MNSWSRFAHPLKFNFVSPTRLIVVFFHWLRSILTFGSLATDSPFFGSQENLELWKPRFVHDENVFQKNVVFTEKRLHKETFF